MYSKYHGCGNDFIIADYDSNIDYSKLTRMICNRYIGIGADTFIVCKKNEMYEAYFYNADGTLAPMCGNGIRCFAAYLYDMEYELKEEYEVKTTTGIRKIIRHGNQYEIDMGKPIFDKNILDINIDDESLINKEFIYLDKKYNLTAVYMTTHHLVIPVDSLDIDDVVGDYFHKLPIFTKKINVDFVKVLNDHTITMRTYERGVGWTKACGSGACSAFVVSKLKGLIGNKAKIVLEYGEITVTEKDGDIIMIGPAKKVATNIEFVDEYKCR